VKAGSSHAPRTVEIATDGVRIPRESARLSRFCGKTLKEAGYSAWKVGILLCGDARMRELNGRYRRRQETTDVLSFPEEEGRTGSPVAGDIAISLDALRRNAAQFDVSENEEMKRLLVHGLLHLAGMDHGRGTKGPMLEIQERLLDTLQSETVFGEGRK
jgi:probable rRNA maturation factor